MVSLFLGEEGGRKGEVRGGGEVFSGLRPAQEARLGQMLPSTGINVEPPEAPGCIRTLEGGAAGCALTVESWAGRAAVRRRCDYGGAAGACGEGRGIGQSQAPKK